MCEGNYTAKGKVVIISTTGGGESPRHSKEKDMSNQINQMLDTLIGVKVDEIKNIQERMARDKELLAQYQTQLAEYEAQKAEAS